jgi:hypothetical protein
MVTKERLLCVKGIRCDGVAMEFTAPNPALHGIMKGFNDSLRVGLIAYLKIQCFFAFDK